ncbi:D-alanine--D-alanine ligase A, partial [bacterium]|nr:D-alanine--D-alanine ligase A [bacterium]
MDKKINVAVFFGGVSGEHEVSLVSGSAIINGLRKNEKYNIIPIGIGKSGRWFLGDNVIDILKSGKEPETDEIIFLSQDPTEKGLIVIKNKDGKVEKEVIKVDVIFPVLHGTNGEDGTIQGLF